MLDACTAWACTLGWWTDVVPERWRCVQSKNAPVTPSQVGQVHSSRRGADDFKTLRSLNFQIGDFLDVAIS